MKRIAFSEYGSPRKRRKRDVTDWRTRRYIDVDLCLTGDCDNVPTRLLDIRPKSQHKKGVVRSLDFESIVSNPAQRQMINWLKQANEIPLNNSEFSASSDHASMRKYHDFIIGKNVGSQVACLSSGVNGKKEDEDVRAIDVENDPDGENGTARKPVERSFFSIFHKAESAQTSLSHQIKQTISAGPSYSNWNRPQFSGSHVPSSVSVPSWCSTFISEQEKESNRIKLKKKLAKYSYTPSRKNSDRDSSVPTEVDGVTCQTKTKLSQFAYSPKNVEQGSENRRKVSVLGDATQITINTRDFVTDLGMKESSPRKYQYQVHNVGMI